MGKVLGLDLGTNSIGWAIVDSSDAEHIIDAGVLIFTEGVKIEKGVESSRAAERTGFRSTRRRIARRRKRKQDTLRVLIENNMCPLGLDDLEEWRKSKKEFPRVPAFLNWLSSSNEAAHTGRPIPENNPYYLRAMAAEQQLTPVQLGRVFYHLAQRRGFLSSRLEKNTEGDTDKAAAADKDTGVVKEQIHALSKEMGDLTLGQYFYRETQKGNRVRARYVGRKEQYFKEFYTICAKQNLSEALTRSLFKAIFYVRPLKSQKGLVGKCPFEKNKPRVPVSHPDFEQFRMFQFINSIRVVDAAGKKRELDVTEVNAIIPLFYRKSKPVFTFEDIKKKLSTKKTPLEFNFKDFTQVSGCPTIASFIGVFGSDWEAGIEQKYKRKIGKNNSEKSRSRLVDDVWHALFTMDDDPLLAWTKNNFDFSPEEVESFNRISLKQGYASLSLLAIRKMLPYLKRGTIYSHAAFFANLNKVVGALANDPAKMTAIKQTIAEIIDDYGDNKKIVQTVNDFIGAFKEKQIAEPGLQFTVPAPEAVQAKLHAIFGKQAISSMHTERLAGITELCTNLLNALHGERKPEFHSVQRIDDQIKALLVNEYNVPEKRLALLYHPSDIEAAAKAKVTAEGILQLGSPFTPSVRNPVVMRTLHMLRKLVNTLLVRRAIAPETPVHIELARELNDANRRKAIERYQRERESNRKKYKDRIIELYAEATGKTIEPNDDDIAKYELWEEQKHVCLYTGKEIGISGFIGANPAFDFEHTIPRSISYDDSMVNLTLCDNYFNREIKRNKPPVELPGYSSILPRLESWRENVQKYEKLYSMLKKGKGNETKESKDARLVKKHNYKMHLDYWRAKLDRFEKTDFTFGFKNSQLVDTGIITKLAFSYMKSVFDNVVAVKGIAVDRFRKTWGIQDEYEKKSRVKHVHHAIDAVVIACMTRDKYAMLAELYHAEEQKDSAKLHNSYAAIKPWSGFTHDLKELENNLIITHDKRDNTLKPTRKKVKLRGKVQFSADGKPKYNKGEAVRGALHAQTFYGAILAKDENGCIEQRYVVRKRIEDITADDTKNIVDPIVRRKIEDALQLFGAETLKQQTVWMHEEKNIPIKKVRVFTRIKNPIAVKEQFNKSAKNYKQFYYAENDANYMMVLYEGADTKGRIKRSFELINVFEAKTKHRNNENLFESFITIDDSKNRIVLPVLLQNEKPVILKPGLSVLLCENSAMEINWSDKEELGKRLYIIIGLSSDKNSACIELRHHQEARPKTEIGGSPRGAFHYGDNITLRRMSQNQFFAYIQNIDFTITPDSEIKKI